MIMLQFILCECSWVILRTSDNYNNVWTMLIENISNVCYRIFCIIPQPNLQNWRRLMDISKERKKKKGGHKSSFWPVSPFQPLNQMNLAALCFLWTFCMRSHIQWVPLQILRNLRNILNSVSTVHDSPGISAISFHCFLDVFIESEDCPKSSLPFIRMKKSK